MKIVHILVLVPLVKCFVIVPGKCPDVQGVENFDGKKMLGDWYIVRLFPNQFDDGYKCSKESTFSYADDVFHGSFEHVNINTNASSGHNLTLKRAEGETAKFTALFTINEVNYKMDNLYFTDTDYDNYRVSYMCVEEGGNSKRVAWLQAKNKRTLSDTLIVKAMKNFDQNGLESQHFTTYNQEDCE